MTKADMVELVYERIGVSKREAATVVESVFDIITANRGGDYNLSSPGFEF